MIHDAVGGLPGTTDDELVRLRVEGVCSREVDGELVVLDFDTSRYLAVRGSGTVLFELLRDPCRRADLVAALVDRFDVDDDTARRDVARFLADLDAVGLLTAAA